MKGNIKTLQLKQYNTDYPVTLTYDKCRSGSNQYGQWNLYGVEYEGESQGLFADDNLHQELKQYGKGTKLVIRRDQDDNGKLEWQVLPQNGKGSSSSNGNTNRSDQTDLYYLDDRTKDIHRQVALKLAVISLGENIRPWSKDDIREIGHRMARLLSILDRDSTDEGPF